MPPAAVIPIHGRYEAEFVRIQLAMPGRPVQDVGVLLVDRDSGKSRLRLRQHWDDLADEEEVDYLAALDRDLHDKIEEMGARRFLESMEDSWSNILRVTDREPVRVDSLTRVAEQLFERYVEPVPVQAWRTHLPLYTLRAAAGKFGADEEVEPEGWVPAPEQLRLNEGMFVAHVEGHSMEPRIPDGSLNVFRAPVVGSRQGKLVLVELIGVHERFTVKRYTSRKTELAEDQWEHAAIRLEPLNPEYERLELTPDQLKYVIAEWICTLD